MNKQIRKMQTAAGGPLFPWQLNTEWVNDWKFRTTPASRSRVLSGKGIETDKQYTKRRKKETTKRTWRSDAADIAHGIGEGILALHPYTAIPYFGAKVGLDFLNGTYGWHTALNASVPLFHMAPQAVGLREATNVALEDIANAGSKTARNLRVAREIKLATKNKPNIEVPKPIIRTKVGDVEIDNPLLSYRLLALGGGQNFIETGYAYTPLETLNIINYQKGLFKPTILLKVGIEPGWTTMRPMYSLGKLWFGLPEKEGDLIVTAQPLQYGNSKGGITHSIKKAGTRRVSDYKGEVTPENSNVYSYEPGYGYKKITQDPSTSLAFFEKKPSKLNESITEKMISPSFDFSSFIKYYLEALSDLKSKQLKAGNAAEEKALSYFNSEKFKNRIKQEGLPEQVQQEMHDNVFTTRGSLDNPLLSGDSKYGIVGEYDNGFKAGLTWSGKLTGSFNPVYRVNPLLPPESVYRNVLHEFGGHGATMGYHPNYFPSSTKGTALFESKMKEWFPHYKQVYEHNLALKPVRKPEFVNSKDPHIEYLEGVDEYSARARAENIEKGGEDFAELYKYFTKESVDKLLNKIVGISIPVTTGGYTLYNLFNQPLQQLQYLKQGGKMNILEFLKNGSGIHIKKKNRGKFTKYCHGKVTNECIRKAKASGNPTLVKRATFAANARKWKHKEGGIIKAEEGTIINKSPIVTLHLLWLLSIPEYLDYKKKIEELKRLLELQEALLKLDMLGSILGTAGNYLLNQLTSKNFKNENSPITNNSSSNNTNNSFFNNTILPNLIYNKPSLFKGYLSSFSS